MSETKNKKKKTSDPIIAPAAESYTVVISSGEMLSVLQILSFSKEVFEQMSKNLAIEGDTKAGDVYMARSQLSQLLLNKFQSVVEVGEPESRHLH